jgi:hypothetical protein
MQRYFFHQVQGGKRIEDPEGSLHPTLDSAKQEALTGALEIMVGRLWKGQDPDHSRFEITDIGGKVVLVVPFKDAIDRGDKHGELSEGKLRQATGG